MGKLQSGLKKLFVPLCVILGIGIALSWYYFGWITSQKEYFRKRDFRLLAVLSNQIRQKIDSFDGVMDHLADQAQERDPKKRAAHLAEYLKFICPDLSYLPAVPPDIQPFLQPHDPPGLAIVRDEGEYQLFFDLERQPDDQKNTKTPQDAGSAEPFVTKGNVRNLISPFAESLRDGFEAILVARHDGTVIFQQSQPGIEVVNIEGLATARAGERIDAKTLGKAASSIEVTLAGATYTLYSQPIPLSYPSVPSSAQPVADTPAGPNSTVKHKANRKHTPTAPIAIEEWIVCGLVRSDRLFKDSMAISYTVIVAVGIGLLLLACLYPFIKLILLRAKERLRSRDGVLLAVSTFICTGLLTFIALDVYYYALGFLNETEGQLVKFARAMELNIQNETKRIWTQLDSFDRSPWLSEDLSSINSAENHGAKKESNRFCHSSAINDSTVVVCERTNLLDANSASTSQADYPYLNLMIWDDTEGRQRIKWTSEDYVTPFLFLPDLHYPYYERLRMESKWLLKGAPSIKANGIALLYSSNTGKNIAVFWRLEPAPKSGSEASSGTKRNPLLSASLVSRPVSLIGPALPAGFQFAVIDSAGQVQFHSDQRKNLLENFFEECDQDPALRSLVVGRASGSLNAYYLGRRHHLHVSPLFLNDDTPGSLPDSPWSLVVFEDMKPQETMNFEALSVSSILFLFYSSMLAIIWALLHFLWRKYPTKWFWPDKEKATAYRLLIFLNAFISALFVVMILRAAPTEVILAGFLIPLLALALTFLVVNHESKAGSSGPFAIAWHLLVTLMKYTERLSWKATHRWARITLMIVVAVLPCFAFFRVAYEIEEMLLIHHGQRQLVTSLHEREERVKREYKLIKLQTNQINTLLRPCNPAQNGEPCGSYHAAFFKTELADNPIPAENSAANWFGDRLIWLLARFRPRYNEIATQPEGLPSAESGPKPRKSSLDFDDDKRELALTRLVKDSTRPFLIRSSWEISPLHSGDWRMWLLLVVFLVIVFAFVGLAGEKVFLLDLLNPAQTAPTSLEEKISTNLLVIGLPGSGKTKAVIKRETGHHDIYRLDLAVNANGNNGVPPFHDESVSKNPNVPVVVDHFEYCAAAEAPCSEQKLQFLEDLVYKQGRTVMLVSSIDPLSYVQSRQEEKPKKTGVVTPAHEGTDQLGHRWARLMSSFARRDFQVPGADQDHEFFQAVAALTQILKERGDPESKQIVRVFEKECSPTPRLRAIGTEFVSRLRDGMKVSPETIASEVLEQAAAYYSLIWDTLSKDEQLALAQLAHEGLVNPKNHFLVAQLMKKGLIVRDPTFRLMNRTFTSWVVSALPPHTMEEWEKEGVRLPWNTLRSMLLAAAACLGVFLYVTQQSLFNSVAAYVAAIAAAIPTVLKFGEMFRRSPGGAK